MGIITGSLWGWTFGLDLFLDLGWVLLDETNDDWLETVFWIYYPFLTVAGDSLLAFDYLSVRLTYMLLRVGDTIIWTVLWAMQVSYMVYVDTNADESWSETRYDRFLADWGAVSAFWIYSLWATSAAVGYYFDYSTYYYDYS